MLPLWEKGVGSALREASIDVDGLLTCRHRLFAAVEVGQADRERAYLGGLVVQHCLAQVGKDTGRVGGGDQFSCRFCAPSGQLERQAVESHRAWRQLIVDGGDRCFVEAFKLALHLAQRSSSCSWRFECDFDEIRAANAGFDPDRRARAGLRMQQPVRFRGAEPKADRAVDGGAHHASPYCPLDSYNWRNVSAFIA